MSTSGHYRANLRDLEFVLFEVLGRDALLGTGAYEDLDPDTARSILAEVERFATDRMARSYVSADRNPPVFDPQTATVTTSAEFRADFGELMDAEWFRLQLPAELGGQPAPPSLQWAVAELLLGANAPVFFSAAGPNFAHAIWRTGTAEQRRIAELMLERRWGATMVLTEPEAGSDVGAGRTRALPNDDGTWRVEGVKCFITTGEWDWPENIMHLVLARPEGVEGVGGPGTKGLSLFLVPKFRFDLQTGELGERNGVRATNLEHKMGLRASPTCELTFGEHEPAIGYLLGDVHDGIRQMFLIIEYARMLVGTKAMATLSSGYLHALSYARDRVQGADLTRANDKHAPRVAITNHPDVRRQLLTLKCHAEGLRALVLYTASVQDAAAVARFEGRRDADAERLNDLLLPVVKGYASERSYALLADALQVLGGSGYLQDYPLEQYLRDSKIDTLYEGTTAIQGLDLFFRKMVRDQFGAVTALGAQIQDFVKGDPGDGALGHEREMLGQALEDVQGMITAMGGFLAASMAEREQVYRVGEHTTRLLLAVGDLVVGWLLLREAEVALGALDRASLPAQDRDFYTGKVAAARYFTAQVLPRLAVDRMITERTDGSLMNVPLAAF
jgi:alkylation response protein AidB-like acyl-CoA dehydrogenase